MYSLNNSINRLALLIGFHHLALVKYLTRFVMLLFTWTTNSVATEQRKEAWIYIS